MTVDVDPVPELSKAATTPNRVLTTISDPTIHNQTGSRFFAGRGAETATAGGRWAAPARCIAGAGGGGGASAG